MRKPKTTDREKILEYMEHRSPSINSRAPITKEESDKILDAFDRFNDYKSVSLLADKTGISPERTKTICFHLSVIGKMQFENRETCPQEFANAKHGRATWVFRCSEPPAPVRLIPNSPLFNVPQTGRERMDSALSKLREELTRYGVEVDTLKIGDTLQVHVKGSPGGLLVAAKYMAHRRF